ncbi:MAG: hypothetical protein ACLSWI_04485 [Candidatus Gastranaerophilaceae bacterium]
MFKITGINSSQENLTINKLEVSASKTTNVPIGQKDVKQEELLLKLGVTYEQYVRLCTENPNFPNLPIEAQQKLATDLLAKTVSEPDVSNINENKQENEVKDLNKHLNNEIDNSVSNEAEPELFYNHKAFSELSVTDKFNTYASELAKNTYLYGDKNAQKSLKEWNALDDEEKNKLIELAKKDFAGSYSKENLYTDEAINFFIEEKMTTLQTANYMNESISAFNDKPDQVKLEDVNTYLVDLSNEKDGAYCSKNQANYVDDQKLISEIIVKACKEKGDHQYDHQGVSFVLSAGEISSKLKELKTSSLELKQTYFQNKKDKGIILTSEEEAELSFLNDLSKTDAGKMAIARARGEKIERENVDFGRIKDLESSEYGDMWKSAKNKDDKAMVLNAYMTKKFGNLSPEDKAKAIEELNGELLNDSDNIELAVVLQSIAIKTADKKTQIAIASSTNSDSQDLNALNAGEFKDNPEATQVLAETQRNIEKENPERAANLAEISMDKMNTEQLVVTRDTYTKFKSESVQNKYVDKGYEAENPDDQKLMLTSVNNNCSLDVRKKAGSRLHEAHKENQVPLTKIFIKDKEVAAAMNESGTLSKSDKDNQKELFTIYKTRFEQSDFTKAEAVKQLNTLSDQIPNCDKSNQLDMHNEIMKSKYSEVQEHAANNINKLDPTVQGAAVESVVRSGNEKAVSLAMNSLTKAAPEVQRQQVINLAVMNSVDNNKNSESEERFKLLNSTNLTPEQFAKLSPAEKREYYKKIFDKASPGEKIEMLSKLPGNQQKTVYTIICRFFPEILSSMVESGQGEKMLQSGLPLDASNKILAAMKRSTNIEVITQLKEIKQDSAYKSFFKDEVKEERSKSQGLEFVTNTLSNDSKIKKLKSNMDLRV